MKRDKPKRKSWHQKRDKLDSLFSDYIRLLSGGICSKCKKNFPVKSRGFHCAHYHSRGKRSTRFERDNATALCTNCHFNLDHHPAEKAEFWINLIGQERFQELDRKAHTPTKIDRGAIERDLKEKIKLLES